MFIICESDLCFAFQVCLVAFSSQILSLVVFPLDLLTVWVTAAHAKDLKKFSSSAVCRKCPLAAQVFLDVFLLRLCNICSILNCPIKNWHEWIDEEAAYDSGIFAHGLLLTWAQWENNGHRNLNRCLTNKNSEWIECPWRQRHSRTVQKQVLLELPLCNSAAVPQPDLQPPSLSSSRVSHAALRHLLLTCSNPFRVTSVIQKC